MNDLISVIMPVYKVDAYLEESRGMEETALALEMIYLYYESGET